MRLHMTVAVAALAWVWAGPSCDVARADESAFRAMVEADWAAQARRRGRSGDSPAATRDALRRAELLLGDLCARADAPNLSSDALRLGQLRAKAAHLAGLDAKARLALYREVRWAVRALALKNPLLAGKRIIFMKRRRFICQMLHEYLGYFCDYGDVAGGGVYVLERPGHSAEARDLIRGRLKRGNYTTLSLSYDGRTVYFAFAERAAKRYDFYSPQRQCFHLYTMTADGKNLRRLTDGPNDDFDPCPLPDGGIAFMSTRRGGFARCNNPWEPLPSYTLHRMDAAGRRVRTLSFHETSEWHPSVLNDGRIVYSRWDYVDRSAANFHGLWVSNPDGSRAGILFGNYTMRVNACFQPRAIPGSRKIAFIAGAHHADVGGALVILDPARARLDAKTGQDDLGSLEVLTPEICFPESAGWPKSYFHSPWPLSENHFLVAFGFDTLPGMSSGNRRRDSTGLYYFDRFGNLELLYREAGVACMYPIPLAARPRPPEIGGELDPALGDEGRFILTDVTKSLFPLPANRRLTQLRIFEILPKTGTHIANRPRIGHANAESARTLLGTVPLEPDGSAYFRAPARKPLYFQAVDAGGRAVQSMRSAVYLQPGESRGCVGCHERPNTAPAPRRLEALRRPASVIRPGPEGTRPLSYRRLVQPVLDARCVRCHDGKAERKGEKSGRTVLTGEPAGSFSRSYHSLRPYVRWYEWGGKSISAIVTRPGRIGADASGLTRILADATHAGRMGLTDPERRRLYIWLDANVPFYGSYETAAQGAGRPVRPAGPPVPAKRDGKYLSDLTWTLGKAGWTKNKDGLPRRDADVEGNPLVLGLRRYAKGIGTHAPSKIVYRLDGKYERFVAVVGGGEAKGTVVFRVFGDGRKLYDSGVMHGLRGTRNVDVPVKGVKELRLEVTDAGDNITCDMATWADARVVPLRTRPGR